MGKNSSILDIGCAKGFMMHDFSKLIPEISVNGVDISDYAIENSMKDIKPYVKVADVRNLPFADNSFDLVISINTIHNLGIEELKKALKEIERVSKKDAFITVDAYRNKEEKEYCFDIITKYFKKFGLEIVNWKRKTGIHGCPLPLENPEEKGYAL